MYQTSDCFSIFDKDNFEDAYKIDLMAGNMCFFNEDSPFHPNPNRFFYDEDTGFELSEVHNLQLDNILNEKGKGTLA